MLVGNNSVEATEVIQQVWQAAGAVHFGIDEIVAW